MDPLKSSPSPGMKPLRRRLVAAAVLCVAAVLLMPPRPAASKLG